MKTRGELVSDLELRFTESRPSDDIELERDQLAHWLDLSANSLLSDYLSKQIVRREDINPFYITSNDYAGASEEGLDDVISSNERYYVDISSLNILPIRGFSRDYGVVRVHDETNKQMVNITYDDSAFYKHLEFACAKDDNIQWYREAGRIYLSGVGINNATFKKFRVFYVEPIDSSSLADTADYPLADDLLPMVVDIAEEVGRRQFLKPIIDLENDGQQ